MTTIYDVAIIGAGAVGSAIARELSKYDVNVVLLESNSDVGMGTSKASTAIWHTGFDATPGTLEAKLLKRSYPLMEAFMKEVGSPFELVGGLLIAWNDEQLHTLPKLLQKAIQNGDNDCYLIDKEEVYKREPHLGEGALGGMVVPREGILCTFTIPLACATQAVVNGVELRLNFRVQSVGSKRSDQLSVNSDVHILSNGHEEVCAHWVVNAAGLFSDEINARFGKSRFALSKIEEFKVTPRRGELIVYDKLARRLVNHILLPVPTATTKGVLVSPTIYGNVLLGPTAEDLDDKSATNTSQNGLMSLLEKGEKILPALLDEEVTATYAGLRAATEHSDYQIALYSEQRYVCVGGIRSTGISGCLGIAEYVVDLLKEGRVELKRKPEFKTIRMPNIGETFMRPHQNAEMIAENSDYGRIVCHCERVSLGELKDAMSSAIPATSLDALRRRTRAMQGRCQGFNCQAALLSSLRGGLRRDSVEIPSKQSPTQTRGLLRGAEAPLAMMSDILIIGAGPAGLSAAIELKKQGIKDILVVDREPEAGGMPRMCHHTGFGREDLWRMWSGPKYAKYYRDLAEKMNVDVRTSTTITGWNDARQISFTSPNGIGMIEAQAVLLATGVRERPRSARLIPGYRPQGVFTTGSLQRFVYEHKLPIGKRAVIVGAELVSLSALMTLTHAGVKCEMMVTEESSHQIEFPYIAMKWLIADLLTRTRIITSARVTNIFGKERVEGIEITRLPKSSKTSGGSEIIECDSVIFTGNWIPEHELARLGGLQINPTTKGPVIDEHFHSSVRGVFVAGNLLRGVETADHCALEGKKAALSIAKFIGNK